MNNTPLLCIMGLAALSRLVALILMPDLSFGDTDVYIEDGRTLFETGLAGNHIYTPLYSILTYITGGGIGTKLADICLSVATVAVIFKLAREIFDRESVALLAALIAAIYPHFLFYSVARLSETLFLFLMCSAFLSLYRMRFGLGSVLLVLAVLTRPSADLIAPVLIVAFATIVHRETPTKSLTHFGRYALIYVALMSPWWAHNYVKYDAFVRLSLGGGKVLYSGNNAHNTSGGGVANNTDADDMDLSGFDQIYDRVKRDEAMAQAAVEFIAENPGRFVELASIKFIRFWRLWPYAPEFQQPHIIAASLLSYGVVLLLSIVFVVRNIGNYWRKSTPILLFIAYLTAIHMVTIGSIRYRLPLEPFLIVFAAFSVTMVGQGWAKFQSLTSHFDNGNH